MSKEKIVIWGRSFTLNAVLAHYQGESVLDSQHDALEWILSTPAALELSKKSVEAYLKKTQPDKFLNGAVDNIFKYVMPRHIYIPHDKNHQAVAIMCDCKFDMEHGLAVVFEDGKFKKIGPQDIIL